MPNDWSHEETDDPLYARLTELFAIQDEIAAPVAGAIEPELLKTEGAQAAARHVRLQMVWDNLKSFGNIRQPPPERARYRIAFKTSRKSVRAGRPLLAAPGRNGSIRAHSSSVKSVG